jgi:hypothetical protein
MGRVADQYPKNERSAKTKEKRMASAGSANNNKLRLTEMQLPELKYKEKFDY